MAENAHVPPAVGQASVVQKSESSQPVSVKQQPEIGAWTHVEDAPHASLVQRFVSLQSSAELQQPVMGVCEHEPEGSLHVSLVQRFMSSQATGVPAMHVPD